MRFPRRALTGLFMFLVLGTSAATAAERYYVVSFGWEGNPPNPRLSHTFATFIKTDDRDGQESLEQFTISWMPATLNIKLIKKPEPGVNLGIRETFDYCKSRGGEVLGLGPYEIKKELYEAALRQMRRLEAGQAA